MKLDFASEEALTRAAGQIARTWRDAAIAPLTVGLTGPLGSGKTTWARAMLRGLGEAGRVPSPTYTLLEHYAAGELTIVHLDLYRLATPDELEYLGVRDWLADPKVWLLVEWPERSPALQAGLDLKLTVAMTGPEAREVGFQACSDTGERAVAAVSDLDSK